MIKITQQTVFSPNVHNQQDRLPSYDLAIFLLELNWLYVCFNKQTIWSRHCARCRYNWLEASSSVRDRKKAQAGAPAYNTSRNGPWGSAPSCMKTPSWISHSNEPSGKLQLWSQLTTSAQKTHRYRIVRVSPRKSHNCELWYKVCCKPLSLGGAFFVNDLKVARIWGPADLPTQRSYPNHIPKESRAKHLFMVSDGM